MNCEIGRRRVGMLGTALLMSSAVQSTARAQRGRLPTDVALPAPMPCTDRPNDVVGLVLEGVAAPAEAVVVFGQAFRPGDVPRGSRLVARLADGRPLQTQLDVKVRHLDGSVRHGIVSLAAPALADGMRIGAVLSRAESGAEAPALETASAARGRGAVVELTASGGGAPWRVDLLAELAAVRGRDARPAPWQSGPLAVQERVIVAVPPAAVGNVTSLRLVADVAFRADGSLWVDTWLRNDVAMRPGAGPVRYSLRVVLDGQEALRVAAVRHAHYQGWGRLLGSARSTGRAPPVAPLVRPDVAYLAETGAIARYDLSTGVASQVLETMGRAVADPGWAAPFAARGITQYMPTAGGRMDIGPVTGWQAAWLMTGDRRAAAHCIGQAEAAGAVPWHFWDGSAGAEGGGWLDVKRWPRLWADPRGAPKTLMQPIPSSEETGWTPSGTHQPALAFVPYLLTGRRAFLDELQAQAAWSVVCHTPDMRSPPGTPEEEDGFLVVRGLEVRASAWTVRDVSNSAWITPDGDVNQAYFRVVAARNWRWLRQQLPELTRLQGEAHGWIFSDPYSDLSGIAPWQQDYFATSAAMAARRGDENARAVLAWMANFLVGRFTATDRGFEPHDGIAYFIAVGERGRDYRWLYRTWAQMGDQTRSRGASNEGSWSKADGNYVHLALQTLNMVYDELGLQEARRVHDWLHSSGAPSIEPAIYAQRPLYNVVARGMPRVPDRVVRCAPTAPSRGI